MGDKQRMVSFSGKMADTRKFWKTSLPTDPSPSPLSACLPPLPRPSHLLLQPRFGFLFFLLHLLPDPGQQNPDLPFPFLPSTTLYVDLCKDARVMIFTFRLKTSDLHNRLPATALWLRRIHCFPRLLHFPIFSNKSILRANLLHLRSPPVQRPRSPISSIALDTSSLESFPRGFIALDPAVCCKAS